MVTRTPKIVKMETAEEAAVAAPATAEKVAATAGATLQPTGDLTMKSMEQALAYTQEQVDKMSKQLMSAYGDVTGFHKDNVDALVQSGTILAKGLENLSKALVTYSQSQLDQGVTTAKALFSVKSLKELVDLQTEFARTSFDAFIAEATKVSELSVQVANEAAEPLTARVNAAVEKLGRPKAA